MLHAILIADLGTLRFKCLRQWGLGAVVARHHLLLVEEITGKGTHSNAANTHKIYVIKVFHTLPLLFNLTHHTLGSVRHAQLHYIL